MDAESVTRATWEYRVWNPGVRASLNDERLQTQLTELGGDGWELVAIAGASYVFKRRT